MPCKTVAEIGRLAIQCLVFALLPSLVWSQDRFPSRPIRLVVASEAGSAPDAIARALAQEMSSSLTSSIVIENRPGAAGTVGAASVSTAAPDGYTMLMGTISNVSLAPSFYSIKYDPIKSFTHIGSVASVPLVLVASPNGVFSDFKSFEDKASKIATLSYSSPGVGGPQHLAGVLLSRQLGLSALHVPYKSGGAAVTAVASGEVQFAFVGIPVAASLVSAKKLIPVFVTSQRRSAALPAVPTAAEVGLRGFEIDNWHALFAPAGLAPSVREILPMQ